MQNRWPTLYVRTLMALLTRPRLFFATGFGAISSPQASSILLVSALFSAASGMLLNHNGAPLSMGLIRLINAIGMAAIGAVIGFLAATVTATAGQRHSFAHFWRIFSLSSGTVLLIAWVPSAFLLTEPWKWWLIGTGMVRGLGMSTTRAVITVLFTFGATVMLIYALLPIIQFCRGLVG